MYFCENKQTFVLSSFRLSQYLESDDIVTIHVEWTVSRKTDAKDSSGVTTTIRDISLPPFINGTFNPTRKKLAALISPTPTANEEEMVITLEHVFPKFLKVTSRTTAPVPQLMKSSLWKRKINFFLNYIFSVLKNK